MKTKYFLIVISLLFINNLMGASLLTSNKLNHLTAKQQVYQKKLQDLDKYYSTKKLGAFVENGKTVFRIFAPQALAVVLCTFVEPEQSKPEKFPLEKDKDGVWEVSLDGELYGRYYGYQIYNVGDDTNKERTIVLDPYAKAVTSYNTYMSPRRGIVIKENDYDWEGDEWVQQDWRDLIIYEMHVRDMTRHESSGVEKPGTYLGLTEKNKKGGLSYIKSLGVNAVELLPAQEFANVEIPFKDSAYGRFNTWNYYERNHWGYMTAAFFSPEAYYSEDALDLQWNTWQGKSGKQVKDFKDMVKAFHKEGIAVIMDVVYNHLSEYEIGNLKEIDKEYYFRLDANGNFIAESYCGNDLKTERPMLRKLIIESILYWMKEYHVDGFRFDLGKLIDWETLEDIIFEAQKINPHVVFVAEPWGGGYDPMGFSLRGWGSWNDQIRNGIKGENPNNGHGWIFGKWYGNNNPQRIKSYVNGTLIVDTLGLFQKKEHSVNYLESHDGYTLGDFIRIGLKDASENEVIKDVDKFVKLTPTQLKLNKLGALFLFTSQGITMIHSGQEFARTKVIPHNIDVNDPHKGMIDHNTYDKDNEVNYINYNHAETNNELLEYYKGLIELRKKYNAFRRAEHNEVTFFSISDNQFAIGFHINHNKEEFIVLMNANFNTEEEFSLPKGKWNVLVNQSKAGTETIETKSGKIVVPPSSGVVLKKKN